MMAQEMLRTHPSGAALDVDALARCIEECFSCAQACTACADACLGEDEVAELTRCIRLNLDCADICAATGAIATRQTAADASLAVMMLEACAEACRRCGEECELHADHHEHCAVCAEACRRCERACTEAVRAVRA